VIKQDMMGVNYHLNPVALFEKIAVKVKAILLAQRLS